MADNVQLNLGVGGDIAAADEIGGIKYQRVKMTWGVDGAAVDVSAAAPIPVDLKTAIPAGANAIGSVSVTNVIPGVAANSLGKAADSAAGATDTGIAPLAIRDDVLSALTPAEGDYAPLRVNSTGALHVVGSSGGGEVTGPAAENAAATGNPVLTGGRYDSSARTLGNGDVGAVALNASGHIIADVSASTGGTATDDAAFTAGSDDGVPIMGAAITDSVDSGDAGAVAMTLDRRLRVTDQAATDGGALLYKNIDVDESEDQVKATAGQIYFLHVMNLASAVRYLKVYNATAASVTVGTTTPDLTFPIPTQGDTNGAGFVLSIPTGLEFDTAITIAATTGIADADTGAPGANEVVVNLGYK